MSPEDEQHDDESLESLLDIVEKAIATGQPVDVLGLASATLAIVLFPEDPPELETSVSPEILRERVVEQVVLRYVEIGNPEALTYATALAALVPGEALRRRLTAALDGAEPDLPDWLARLDDAVLEQPTVVRDLFDDDEWLLAGVRFADGSRLAFRVEIDHDVDSSVTNAMLMPTTVDDVKERLRTTASEDEVAIVDIDPDDFWARYTEAVAVADELDDTTRTDTWPSCRPAIEWALHQAPTDRRTAG
jgi:hypothetical protein